MAIWIEKTCLEEALFILFQRVNLCVIAGIEYNWKDIYQQQQDNGAGNNEIERCEYGCIATKVDLTGIGSKTGETDEKRIDNDEQQAEFGGAQFGIGEAEFASEMGIDTDIHGHKEVEDENYQSQIEMHKWREAGPDKHETFIDTVNSMVEIIAVYGTLAVADPGQGAVKRIAIPIDHQSKRA